MTPRSTTSVAVCLALLSAAGAAGLGRLLTEPARVWPAVVAVVVAHALRARLRRTSLPLVGRDAVFLAGGVLVAVWLVLPGTVAAGIPTTETLRQAAEGLAHAWETFATEVAPVEPTPGVVLAMVVCAWTAAGVADWAAFELGTRFEATIPAITLFAFASALGPDNGRLAATTLLLGGLAAFLGAHHVSATAARLPWLGGPTARRYGGRALGGRAALVGTAAVAVTIALGPQIPGIADSGLVEWKGGLGDGGGSRVTVSPLVDIRGRLVQQSQVEVFRVRADQRAYWRLTALDRFDGQIWSSLASYHGAAGDLPSTATGHGEVPMRQDYEISNLGTIWLPAAFRPVFVDPPSGSDVRWDPASGTLLTEQDVADFLAYEVVSELPVFDPELLARAQTARQDEGYLALPEGWSPRARRLAAEVTAGAGSPYERARRLQDWFRTEFTYSLDVPVGHSIDAVEHFLFVSRTGYCEQFAGTYAAMARSLGLPSRVAVGFTPGEIGPDGWYRVRGANAHAWPEVWIDGAGWVAFEPTPGRGAPGAEAWTGVPEQQASAGDPTTATTLPSESTTPTTAGAGPAPGVAQPPTAETVPPAEEPAAGRWWPTALLAIAALIVTGGAGAGVAAGLTVRRRAERRRAATDPATKVALTWRETTEMLADAGLTPAGGETPVRFAARIGGRLDVAEPLAMLASAVERSTYAPADPTDEDASAAARAGDEVSARVAQTFDRRTRLRRALAWTRVPAEVDSRGRGVSARRA